MNAIAAQKKTVMQRHRLRGGGQSGDPDDLKIPYADMAEDDIGHFFNEEFREELRNRGRMHFEKIIEDNAMTVPNTPGVTIHDAGTVFLNGSGSITHVIDNTGNSVSSANAGSFSPVVTYP